MLAVDHVFEEPLGVRQPRPLLPDTAEAPLDHGGSLRLPPVQDLADLGKAQPGGLAGPQDAQAVHVLLAVITVTRRRAVRDHDARLIPVPQYVNGHSETVRGLSDLHGAIVGP